MNNKILLSIIAALIVVVIAEVWYLSGSDEAPATVATENVEVVMYKNPGCMCCDKWAAHMEQAGFTVAIEPTPRLAAIKGEQNVPYQMGACHTAVIGDYVVEGHVPAEDVKRLIKEQPEAVGIAVPGMPAGSPGMPSPNPEPFRVYLIGDDGNLSIFAEHQQGVVSSE